MNEERVSYVEAAVDIAVSARYRYFVQAVGMYGHLFCPPAQGVRSARPLKACESECT